MASLLILLPLAAILLLNLLHKGSRQAITFFAVVFFCFQIWTVLFSRSLLGAANPLSSIFNFSIELDPLSVIFLAIIPIIALTTLLCGHHSMEVGNKKTTFVNLITITALGMNAIVMATDLFTMYVFLEVVSVASFVLISLNNEKHGLEGTFKYLVLSSLATVMMISAIALLTLVSPDLSFTTVKLSLVGWQSSFTKIAFALFVAGLLIKSGIVPFHGWLPDAYSAAPSEVSILLAGIVTKTTGVYTLFRIVVSVFGFTPQMTAVLLLLGTASIYLGAFAAIGQKNFKRMLAYSSISQVGYIIAGFSTGTQLGMAGAAFHIFNHSIFKAQLFANSLAVEKQTGTNDMTKLGGLAERMPVTGWTSVVAFLSTAGIPPLAGFWSKLIILIALWQSGHRVYMMLALLASLVTLAYFLRMNRQVFFGKVREGFENLKEAKPGIVFPAVILCLITIGTGIFFNQILDNLIMPISKIIH
jgi:multicomponent Na+:H+ antiporter subunit D